MPIPLGILAAAGIRPAVAAGAYELIETYNVTTSGIATVTFNVSSYNTTYQHLQIRTIDRSTQNQTEAFSYLRFNSDSTSSNYAQHFLYGDGGGPYSFAASPIDLYTTGATAASGNFIARVIDILDPYETKNKTVRMLSGGAQSGYNRIILQSGLWMNTTQVSSVSLVSAANWAIGTRFSIYGLKAS